MSKSVILALAFIVPVVAQVNPSGNGMLISVDANGNTIPANASAPNADAVNNTNTTPTGIGGATLYYRALSYLFDGTAWNRVRSASLLNLTASTSGGLLTEKGPRWSITNAPGLGNQATTSKAAGGAGVRHVVDCISWTAAPANPAAAIVGVFVRDGAPGAGTIIWQYAANLAGTANVSDRICGLNLVGSVNTAMTVEFNAGLALVSQAVNLSGYDVQ